MTAQPADPPPPDRSGYRDPDPVIDAAIRRLVAKAPALTDAQAQRLNRLFNGGGDAA
jgi:hypothetical protein